MRESRVSIFLDKLIRAIPRRLVQAKLIERHIGPIKHQNTKKPDNQISTRDLPCFRLRQQGLSQPHTYDSWRFSDIRLEITYSADKGHGIREAERYLEAVSLEVGRMLYDSKQKFGIQKVDPLLRVTATDPGNAHVIQMIEQYELRLM